MKNIEHIQEIEKSGYDTIVEIEKFNPFHDARGRFSSADNATQFTYAPGKSKAHDMAIAREKERHARMLANPTNDPETIVGVKRGPAMTHEQADAGRSNPRYIDIAAEKAKLDEYRKKYNDAVNRGASAEEIEIIRETHNRMVTEYNQMVDDSRPYRINCQSCVVAYEARLRGYDVEAKPRTKQNSIQESLARNPVLAWNDPATGLAADVTVNSPNIRTSKQAQNWLDQNVQEGARYTFSHGWKGTSGHKGHIVSATKENGNLRLFDPQDGKTYTGDSLTQYMGRVRSTYNNGKELKGRLQLIRVDNKQLDVQVVNAVLKGAGR